MNVGNVTFTCLFVRHWVETCLTFCLKNPCQFSNFYSQENANVLISSPGIIDNGLIKQNPYGSNMSSNPLQAKQGLFTSIPDGENLPKRTHHSTLNF